MKLIQKILLATDFSKSAENVLKTGITLAKTFHSKIIPVHVLPDDIENQKVATLLNETARSKLETVVSSIKNQGVEAGDPILIFGTPYEMIVEEAISADANLIVVGSGSHKKNEKFQLGITAERIIQRSPKPVLVVKEYTPLNVKHILCPVDFSDTSKQALNNATAMAYRFDAALTVLNVFEMQDASWFTSEAERKTDNDKRYAQHEARLDQFLKGSNLGGLTAHKVVRSGNPASEILKYIREKDIDLLVIGTVGRTGLSRLIMGSVTEKVVREMPCSFVTLKSEDVIRLQLETNIRDIANHYNTAVQLMEDGFYAEAINQFKVCLSINNMHAPSYFGISKVYEKLGNAAKAKAYKESGKEILDRIWYTKIEHEVRKFRTS